MCSTVRSRRLPAHRSLLFTDSNTTSEKSKSSTAWLKFVYRPGVQRMSGGSIEKEEDDCQIEEDVKLRGGILSLYRTTLESGSVRIRFYEPSTEVEE
jgi:hypothetical protein